MKLRAYQKRALKQAEGMQRVVFVAPMGAGKGTMAAHLIAEAVKRGERVLFIVHLRDIADDMVKRVKSYGMKASTVFPPYGMMDANADVQIATVQSLPGKKLGSFDLVIVDEAHHYRADEWEKFTRQVSKGARLVGFTATPQRADGKGLGSVFKNMVNVVTYQKLLEGKYIVPCRLKVPPYRMDGQIAMEPAEAYLEYARGKSAIVFVRNLKTAGSVCQKLRDAGVTAEIIADKTKHEDRTRFIAQLRNGKTKVVVNYGTMTEGIDVPRVSCIVLEQSCRHVGAYLQRVGRGLRKFNGKKSMMLLDLSGASYKHGVPTSDHREYDLSDKPIKFADGVEMVRRQPTKVGAKVVGVGLVDADEEWLSRNGGPRFVRWEYVDWSLTDLAIAKQCGVSAGTVRLKRIGLGIETRNEQAKKRIARAAQDVIEGMSMKDAALRNGIKPSQLTIHVPSELRSHVRRRSRLEVISRNRAMGIKRRKRILVYENRLGREPDEKIAESYGVTIKSVLYARKNRRILAFNTAQMESE